MVAFPKWGPSQTFYGGAADVPTLSGLLREAVEHKKTVEASSAWVGLQVTPGHSLADEADHHVRHASAAADREGVGDEGRAGRAEIGSLFLAAVVLNSERVPAVVE